MNKRAISNFVQQLQIPDDLINQYLQGGGIERLVIDKANKSWHFNLQVPRILPTELYMNC